ncbi:MAG: hypothetical protein ACYSUK_06030 [Planctomycetota bacterium]
MTSKKACLLFLLHALVFWLLVQQFRFTQISFRYRSPSTGLADDLWVSDEVFVVFKVILVKVYINQVAQMTCVA